MMVIGWDNRRPGARNGTGSMFLIRDAVVGVAKRDRSTTSTLLVLYSTSYRGTVHHAGTTMGVSFTRYFVEYEVLRTVNELLEITLDECFMLHASCYIVRK